MLIKSFKGLLALVTITVPMQATSVLNGSFSMVGTATASFSINLDTTLPDWTATPSGNAELDCLVFAGATTNICGTQADGGGQSFWVFPGSSPDGGNYVAVDGVSTYATPLTQTFTGSNKLIAGQRYAISFWQAAAQQSGFTGATTEQWQVSLGGSASQLSTLMNTPSHGDVGWNFQSLTFTAGATQVLQFVAKGTPNGQPPFVLLDGVSITAVPEPGTLAMIGIALITLPMGRKLWKKMRRPVPTSPF